MLPRITFGLGLVCATVGAFAEVPAQINHQGVIKVAGVPFDGNGLFKFAIVDPDTGVNLWCNDDNDPADAPEDCAYEIGVVPTSAVGLPVKAGVYSVQLGDTGLSNMTPIAPTVFDDSNAALRIWFDDGVNGMQQLTPDHPLTSSPYSHQAAFQPPIGAIIAWHKNAVSPELALPSGWAECDGQPVSVAKNGPMDPDGDGLYTPPNLNEPPPFGESTNQYTAGRFLRGAPASGDMQEASAVAEFGGQWDLYSWAPLRKQDAFDFTAPFSAAPLIEDGPMQRDVPESGYAATRPVNMSVVWIIRVK